MEGIQIMLSFGSVPTDGAPASTISKSVFSYSVAESVKLDRPPCPLCCVAGATMSTLCPAAWSRRYISRMLAVPKSSSLPIMMFRPETGALRARVAARPAERKCMMLGL